MAEVLIAQCVEEKSCLVAEKNNEQTVSNLQMLRIRNWQQTKTAMSTKLVF